MIVNLHYFCQLLLCSVRNLKRTLWRGTASDFSMEDGPNATVEELREEVPSWRRSASVPRHLVEGELCCICLETLSEGCLTKTSCQLKVKKISFQIIVIFILVHWF